MSESKTSLQFRHIKTKIDKFSIVNGAPLKNDVEKKVALKFGLQTGVNEEKKIVGIKITIDCEIDKENKAELTSSFHYHIKNFDDFAKEDVLEIPEKLLVALVAVSFSMSKGIWFVKTAGTNLNITLPIIDPMELLKGKRSD